MLTKNEVIAMCDSSKLEEVGVCMVNRYMNMLEQIQVNMKLQRCVIETTSLWGIYKQFKGATKIASKVLRIVCLLNPHQMASSLLEPSFHGAHILKLFAPNPIVVKNPHLHVDVMKVEHNFGKKGQDKRDRIELWTLLDGSMPYFKGL